jgi:DinB superfamily
MGAKAEELARQFEARAQEAAAVVAKLSDADWKKVTEAERWPVGVTAHHLAGALEVVAGLVTALASGHSPGALTSTMLDEMNARHAREHVDCTRAETLALLQKGAATATAVIRGLGDEQLTRSGTIFTDLPPMTVEQLVVMGLITHIDEHFGSIRKTIAR